MIAGHIFENIQKHCVRNASLEKSFVIRYVWLNFVSVVGEGGRTTSKNVLVLLGVDKRVGAGHDSSP